MAFKSYFEITKAIFFGLVILFMVTAGLKGYAWINMKFEHQEAIYAAEMEANRQKHELELNLIRAETKVVTESSKEWKASIASVEKKIVEMAKANEEKIKNIGEVVASVNENLSRELKKVSDHAYKAGTGDINEQYFVKIPMKEKNEDGELIEIAVAWAIFYPNKPENEKWKTGVYPLEYKTKIVQTEQKDGQYNSYIEAWAENNKDNDSEGKKLPMKVDAQFVQLKKNDKEFYWWAPHVNLNLDFGLSGFDVDESIAGGISFSASGYGRTKVDLDWRFVDIGLSSNGDDTYFKIAPFAYNIGRQIPLIENTFLGPFIGRSTEGKTLFGISLSVPF